MQLLIEILYQTPSHHKNIFQRKELKTQMQEKTLKFEPNDHIQSIGMVRNMFNKDAATKRPNTHT